MTLRTLLGPSNKQNSMYYLISWPEEGDSLTVVPGYKITTPKEELVPGCMCHVKGFEKHPAKIVASGDHKEMTKKMEGHIEDAVEPPRKKARVEDERNKENIVKKRKGENKKTTALRKKKGKEAKKGSIITVGSMEATPAIPSPPPAPPSPPPAPPSPPPSQSMEEHVPPPTLALPDPEADWYKDTCTSNCVSPTLPANTQSFKSISPPGSPAISESDPLLLEITVLEQGKRISALECLVQELVKTVKELKCKLEDKSTPATPPPPSPADYPPSTPPTPPPPIPPRCPLAQRGPVTPQREAPRYGNCSITPHYIQASQGSSPIPPPPTCNTPQTPTGPAVSHRTLPSLAINKQGLKSIQQVMAENGQLTSYTSKITTLAVILAREAVFGDDVLGRCTAKGCGDRPALPHGELLQIKQTIYSAYPQFKESPHVFEAHWTKCTDAISQACKRARNKQKRSGLNIV